jgi:hypothetical protein
LSKRKNSMRLQFEILFIAMSDSILSTWSELMLISHPRMRWQSNEERKMYIKRKKTLSFSFLLLQPTPEQITNLFSIAHNFFPSFTSNETHPSVLLNINNNSRKIAFIYLINFCQYRRKAFYPFSEISIFFCVCHKWTSAFRWIFLLYFYLPFPSMWFFFPPSLSYRYVDCIYSVWERLARVDMRK